MNKRNFLKTLSVFPCVVPFISFGFEQLSKKYHKITKDWSFSTCSVTHWNDFNVYSKVGLSKDEYFSFFETNNESEYVLRSSEVPYIYVNKDKCYEISNFKGNFVKNTNQKFYEVNFDIIKYLGSTPTERIVIIFGFDYCIYALGRDYYKEVEREFAPFGIRKGRVLDKQKIYCPLTEEMHSKIKYSGFNRKTYQQYLNEFNIKIKELNLT